MAGDIQIVDFGPELQKAYERIAALEGEIENVWRAAEGPDSSVTLPASDLVCKVGEIRVGRDQLLDSCERRGEKIAALEGERDRARDVLAKAWSFEADVGDPRQGWRPTLVEKMRQADGSTLWAVRRGGDVYGRDGWEYEPLPSSRDDEFFARCRWATFDAAMEAADRAAR